ncbi:MAG: hypothetical protein JW828_13500, partial [Sedimentisphaerales bacterium]|nr:hypothetical protein [Sedimentisphaerales bacterium]
MRKLIDPRQTRLFDPFDSVLTPQTRKHLLAGWPGVFRHVLLELMPVGALAEHFDPVMGRPSKELYSMAGLIFLKECFHWINDEALNAYRFRLDVHYALNLEPVAQDISIRTLERTIARFEEDELAKTVLADVTVRLVELLELKIDTQRLDSTHIFSDMASFGRTRLMGVAIKRFLTQVKRLEPNDYESLDESLRQRYVPGVNQLFADVAKDTDSRRLLRQQVAEDMHSLIKYFSDHPKHSGKGIYKNLVRLFYEQCEVHEETVQVKAKTGGHVMQNPSDADATYDGHKGSGYQVQLSETCHPENQVQLITCAIPQTAVEPDSEAVEPVLDDLEQNALLPEQMLADTHYCSDENVQQAEQRGVELVGPVSGSDKNREQASYEQLTIDDFDIDEHTEAVQCCPAGYTPESSTVDEQTEKTTTVMPASACGRCEFYEPCPVAKRNGHYRLEHTAKQRRLTARRREQETE